MWAPDISLNGGVYYLRDGDQDLLVHHMYDGKRGGAAVLQVRPITWTANGWPEIGQPLGGP